MLNLCHQELRNFWRQKWVQPRTNKVHLVECPESLYVYVCTAGISSKLSLLLSIQVNVVTFGSKALTWQLPKDYHLNTLQNVMATVSIFHTHSHTVARQVVIISMCLLLPNNNFALGDDTWWHNITCNWCVNTAVIWKVYIESVNMFLGTIIKTLRIDCLTAYSTAEVLSHHLFLLIVWCWENGE